MKRSGLSREAQLNIAWNASTFLVEKYLQDPTRRPKDPAEALELLRELQVLSRTRHAAYLLLEASINDASPLLVTVMRLRMLPPFDPPVAHPALRLAVDNTRKTPTARSSPPLGKDPVFWNVDGVPVVAMPTKDGGFRVLAFDEPKGREVPLSYTSEGVLFSKDDFNRLRKSFQPPRKVS